ncbi:golgi transport complex component [Grosmannia clavigera kw1407]|uniref:Conserved oligomeric Golgi complex subunit 5 n=1 Tax=Grosmannia clavigera (strain kw1407 / UAMH 11150) TaxID=655863 RepID=F0XFE6_GROCL|nr:golgi transport complex component [Grosmannia clavigera kw1407]EFX03622.1 golgi transport complex component [Grosmannia clavigera kw1407]
MMAETTGEEQPSYIDYETFLAPSFDPCAFANTLVHSTNDPNDTPLDLSTPLSRVLFDIQEIDSHIDLLTARSAIPLLAHTKEQTEKSTRVLGELEPQVQSLQDSYKRLEKEVIQKHAEADEVRRVVVRLWDTLRLGRSVGRCLQLGRQLEVQHAELAAGDASRRTDDSHQALVRCAHTILSLREILQQKAPSEEGYGLDKVNAIRTLQASVVGPVQTSVQETAERIIREFSLGSTGGSLTFAQSEEAKARTVSALTALYLVSPTALARNETWSPATMLHALESYLRAALQSSISGLARSLAALPSLERTLGEVSARCQNVVTLEGLLKSTPVPPHPLRALLTIPATSAAVADNANLLHPLLARLETGSLASYFWRTLASNLSARVQDIMNRGGVSARTLRTNRNSVGEAIRECVLRGVLPAGNTAASNRAGGSGKAAVWDREVAVMMGSVIGNLGR